MTGIVRRRENSMESLQKDMAKDTQRPEFELGKFGWQGELEGFIDRLINSVDGFPYMVVRCSCGGFLSDRCDCENVMVVPVFNASEEWMKQWHQSH